MWLLQSKMETHERGLVSPDRILSFSLEDAKIIVLSFAIEVPELLTSLVLTMSLTNASKKVIFLWLFIFKAQNNICNNNHFVPVFVCRDESYEGLHWILIGSTERRVAFCSTWCGRKYGRKSSPCFLLRQPEFHTVSCRHWYAWKGRLSWW